MNEITKTEIAVILQIIKHPQIDYNSNNLAKAIGVTPMGALKVVKRLERESILKAKKFGNTTIYSFNPENIYAKQHVTLIISREAQYVSPLIKRWILELKKIQSAEMIILFGSVLEKSIPNDIDILCMTNQKNFSKLQLEVERINDINIKKIHPLYQTKDDVISNIKKGDKPILNAINGIVIFGQEKFLEIYHESRKE